MAKTKLTDKEQVEEHIGKLGENVAAIVQKIRLIILAVDSSISEHIKWNNPSFYYNGEMKPFDPKEYKRDIAVFNLHKERIMVVFPSGAKVNDISGLLTGKYPDGRRIAIFKDLAQVDERTEDLRNVIRKWLDLVD